MKMLDSIQIKKKKIVFLDKFSITTYPFLVCPYYNLVKTFQLLHIDLLKFGLKKLLHDFWIEL